MNVYLWSQLRHRARRSLMVVAGVAIGAALFVSLTAMGAGYEQAARAPLADVAADLVLTKQDSTASPQRNRGVRVPDGTAAFSAADLSSVTTTPDVSTVAGSVLLWDFGPRQTTVVAGVDVGQPELGPGRVLSTQVKEGKAFGASDTGVAVLDRHYAAFYDLGIGSSVTVGGESFRAVGIVEVADSSQAAAANLYLPLGEARRLAGLAPDEVNQVHVRLDDAGDTEAVVAELTRRLGSVRTLTEDDVVQIFGAVGEISSRFAAVAALVALVAGGLLAWLALRGMVGERAMEIGLLRAVGWRRRDVVRAFVAESAVLSVVGAVVGLALGLLIATVLANLPLPEVDLGAGHTGLPGAEHAEPGTLPATVSAASALVATVGAVVSGTLAGLLASSRLAAIRPAQNLLGR